MSTCSRSVAAGSGAGGREWCAECAPLQFRRTASLRLRGERAPLAPRAGPAACASILEHPARAPRQRSRSLNISSGLKLKSNKPNAKSTPNSRMDSQPSETDNGHTPPASPDDLPDDDSLHSYSSVNTANSCDAGYAPFNGTTFSGRSMRYVLHCSSHAGLAGDDYLTPTQRAQKQIRRLKNLLCQAKKDLDKKDSEIFHLTKEVVELRLYKASLCSPDEKSNSSEIVTIRENPEEGGEANCSKHEESYDATDAAYKQTPTRSHNSDMQSSFTDSGHFEDLTNSSLHSKDSIQIHLHDVSCMTDIGEQEEERRKLIELYEKKIEDMVRAHVGDTQDLKKLHNDKVEALLQKFADMNTRYCELLPSCDQAKERIYILERQLEEVSKQLAEEEQRHQSMYVQMYNKGVEAAKFDLSDKELSEGQVNRVSVSQLLEQLQITQTELDNVRAMYRRIVESQAGSKQNIDPEVTLQFLKSAVYYFLTDPENHQGHLNAIESILGFTEAEKKNIQKARSQ